YSWTWASRHSTFGAPPNPSARRKKGRISARLSQAVRPNRVLRPLTASGGPYTLSRVARLQRPRLQPTYTRRGQKYRKNHKKQLLLDARQLYHLLRNLEPESRCRFLDFLGDEI